MIAGALPRVEPRVSAEQPIENVGNAGVPTVPTVFRARTNAQFPSQILITSFFLSHAREICVGTVGTPANQYKSFTYLAEGWGLTLGKAPATI